MIDGFANNHIHGFTKADELWSNMQENVLALINTPSYRAANYYTQHNYIAGRDWADVQRYLRGNYFL